MSDIVRTTISTSTINTPLLNATVANIDKLSLNNVENFQSKQAFIDDLTIKKLTVLDEESVETDLEKSETFEESNYFDGIVLDFADNYNCVYTTANEKMLESAEDCKILTINFNIPEILGSKLVCRYLVLDLRNEPAENVVATVWNNAINVAWLYGMPDIQAGYFYVIAFQRFAKDLIVGNVSVKLASV